MERYQAFERGCCCCRGGRDIFWWSMDFEVFHRRIAFFKVRCSSRRNPTHDPNEIDKADSSGSKRDLHTENLET
jgi:hypothetical protein